MHTAQIWHCISVNYHVREWGLEILQLAWININSCMTNSSVLMASMDWCMTPEKTWKNYNTSCSTMNDQHIPNGAPLESRIPRPSLTPSKMDVPRFLTQKPWTTIARLNLFSNKLSNQCPEDISTIAADSLARYYLCSMPCTWISR